MSQPVFRFAPSPNGRLHLGHAYSALLNEKMARQADGQLLLRIEDTDTSRCTPELTQYVLDDLAWLGIRFEPNPRIQSAHFGDYDNALQTLWQHGAVFPCFCSRRHASVLGTKDPDGQPHYAGTCRGLSAHEASLRLQRGDLHGFRLKTENTEAGIWGDVMIAKRGGSSYHIAVVVDDAAQGVTHVVRGKDLAAATSIHTLLQHKLGFATPHYDHHDLLQDEAGQKLSKRLESRSLASLRAEGVSAADLRAKLGFS
jgi:glutamyl-Q tRNA(Asp) synthetase